MKGMARILIPLAAQDFDPTEAAVSWRVLTGLGHAVRFATPDGTPARGDELMLTGEGLDLWGFIPGLRRLPLLGRILAANRDGRAAYRAMESAPEYRAPLLWESVTAIDYDALLLPGGHRARGMRGYLESAVLQRLCVDAFARGVPVAAVCHGVVLLARSVDPKTGRSVLHGRKTTALTWQLERTAARLGRVFRFWDPGYYRTYPDGPGEAEGTRSVQAEVTRALSRPEDFLDVPADDPLRARKTGGRARDTEADATPAFVVRDGRYVSARWPGDVHTFARVFSEVITEEERQS